MAYYRKTKRVGQIPAIINSLNHGFAWASDTDINGMLLRRYRLYDYLTHNDTANTMMLQSIIDQWHDYIDKLYATTIYEYDPILNYDKHWEGTITDAHHKGSKQEIEHHKGTKESVSTDVTSTETPRVSQTTDDYTFGFDSGDTGSPAAKTVVNAPTGTNSTKTEGDSADNYRIVEDIDETHFDKDVVTNSDTDATHFDKDVKSFESYREYGNIGVMTTQDIIQRERDIIVDVLDVYISKFADCFDISSDVLCGWLSDDEEE